MAGVISCKYIGIWINLASNFYFAIFCQNIETTECFYGFLFAMCRYHKMLYMATTCLNFKGIPQSFKASKADVPFLITMFVTFKKQRHIRFKFACTWIHNKLKSSKKNVPNDKSKTQFPKRTYSEAKNWEKFSEKLSFEYFNTSCSACYRSVIFIFALGIKLIWSKSE